MEERLKNRAYVLLSSLETYIREVEQAELTNKQWFIEFENQINELSIKDHNADTE